jgi:hypothetical protein
VIHLGGAGGTKLDGRKLAAQTPHALPARCTLRVSDVLDLEVTVAGSPPSVRIERPSNGKEHAYALVPASLRSSDGEVLCQDGALLLRESEAGPPRPLVEGMTARIDGKLVRVRSIRPEDQK